MTAPLLAPVIPSSRVSEARQRPGSATGRPLPLAHAEPVPPAPEDVVYGIGRIDASGRIADRTVTSALGWSAGDRLTLTAGDNRPPRPGRHGDPARPGVHRDPRRAAPPLRPAARRPGTAGRSACLRHPHCLLSRRGGPGPSRPRLLPARARSFPMTATSVSRRLAAGRLGRGAADPGADGPVPLTT